MVTLRKDDVWLGVAATAQVAALFITNYIFVDRMYDTLTALDRALSQSGMTVDQVQAISRALYSFRVNVSFFVTDLGGALIAINLVMLKFLLNNRKQE